MRAGIERVFKMPPEAADRPLRWVAGGIAGLAVALVGGVVGVRIRAGQPTFGMMTAAPAAFGVGALFSAWVTMRTPREVGLGPQGIRIARKNGSQTCEWSRVGWSVVHRAPFGRCRHLNLYDVEGRTLARLSDAIENFDELVELLAVHIAARGDDAPAQIKMAKARPAAAFLVITGTIMLALAGATAWVTGQDQRARKLLHETGVPGTARVGNRFLAPDGVTPWLEYRITTPQGRTATCHAEMERAAWDALEGADTVPVVYVPEDPSNSRLSAGQAEDYWANREPALGYGVCGLGALFCLLVIAVGGLAWRGWEFPIDPKTGRLSVKRPEG